MKPLHLHDEPTTAEEVLARVREVRARLFNPPVRFVEPPPALPAPQPDASLIPLERVHLIPQSKLDRHERIAELYAQGAEPKRIAAEVGYANPGCVIRALRRMGLYDPSRSKVRPSREKQRAAWDRIAQLYGQGRTISDIKRKVGYKCHASVIHALKRMGLYVRKLDPELCARRAEARKNPETSLNAAKRARMAERIAAGQPRSGRHAKLRASDVLAIRQAMDGFLPDRVHSWRAAQVVEQLSETYGVCRAHIRRLVRRVQWKHLP